MRNERLDLGLPLGAGAAAFARSLTAGLSPQEIEYVAPQILSGEYHDATDPKIKDCGYCGHLYRDETKNNSSKTCSTDCKAELDAERKRNKRADIKQEDVNRSFTITERHYEAYGGEYPFWNAIGPQSSDEIMDGIFYRNEKPKAPDKLEFIDGVMQIWGSQSNRKGRRNSSERKDAEY